MSVCALYLFVCDMHISFVCVHVVCCMFMLPVCVYNSIVYFYCAIQMILP